MVVGQATVVDLREGSREAAVFVPGDERWAALADEAGSRRWWMSGDLATVEVRGDGRLGVLEQGGCRERRRPAIARRQEESGTGAWKKTRNWGIPELGICLM
jgi:hypothetical protein